MRIIKAVSK